MRPSQVIKIGLLEERTYEPSPEDLKEPVRKSLVQSILETKIC